MWSFHSPHLTELWLDGRGILQSRCCLFTSSVKQTVQTNKLTRLRSTHSRSAYSPHVSTCTWNAPLVEASPQRQGLISACGPCCISSPRFSLSPFTVTVHPNKAPQNIYIWWIGKLNHLFNRWRNQPASKWTITWIYSDLLNILLHYLKMFWWQLLMHSGKFLSTLVFHVDSTTQQTTKCPQRYSGRFNKSHPTKRRIDFSFISVHP